MLFIEKDRPKSQAGRINLPGGKIDPTYASPEDAIRRELKEECGIDQLDSLNYLGRITGRWTEDTAYNIHCFNASIASYSNDFEIKPREGETERVFWECTRLPQVDPRCLPNLRLIVPLMKAGASNWVITDENDGFNVRPYSVEFRLES
jgi:8-oxo-dGTP pyrophosphatase MutT (NUDIX family)